MGLSTTKRFKQCPATGNVMPCLEVADMWARFLGVGVVKNEGQKAVWQLTRSSKSIPSFSSHEYVRNYC